ncbi:uncharacterized protein LOC143907300 isoform X2 [Temnothorax americanus]|uniref:uncharacterized protein LOC143907300 isoform X2 n=1 Tax=Temnothorax americanus TaxID=1964332 RepID=UPI0040689B03
MQRICTRCSKSIAGLFESCVECGRAFHPGCVRAYLVTKSAGDCCRERLSKMPLTPRDTQAPRSSDLRSSASPGVGATASPGAHSSTTDALLQSILSKIEESDKKFAARLDELDKKFTAVFEKSDKKISAFIGRQEAVNADFARKLDQLPDILKIAKDHGERIAALEARSVQLESAQRVACESSAASSVSRTSDIIISGIPSEITEASGVIARSVFTALGIPQLVTDVLETRDAACVEQGW